MYQRILLPVDLADPNLAKPALDTAVMLAKGSGGSIQLINVLPVTPPMLMEYVPARFRRAATQVGGRRAAIIAGEIALAAGHVTLSGPARRQSTRRSLKRRRSSKPT